MFLLSMGRGINIKNIEIISHCKLSNVILFTQTIQKYLRTSKSDICIEVCLDITNCRPSVDMLPDIG